MEAGYIGIAASNQQTFSNTLSNDLVFYTPEPSRLIFGTMSNTSSAFDVSGSNVTVNGTLYVSSGAGITGLTTIYNDLYVQGNIITKQDLVMSGNQIATGASYCNGDLYVVNTTSNLPTSNAAIYVSSVSGLPVVSIQQSSNPFTGPLLLYQTLNGDAYIANTKNIHHGRSSAATYTTLTSNGDLGVNTTNPRAKLDVNGDINSRNLMRLKKSIGSSNALSVNINWSNVSFAPHHAITFKTTQQLNASVLQGSRMQKHRMILTAASNIQYIPQVACGVGDRESYVNLFISASNASSTSIAVLSFVSGPPITTNSNVIHELCVEVDIAPTSLGHVWLT